jgi:hypothetical protein
LSQSPGPAALLLNGAASNYLSTTSSAAAAAGAVVIPMTSTTGVVVGQSVTDSTAAVLVTGTKVTAVNATQIVIWPPVGGAGVGSGDTIVFSGTAIIDTASAANSAAGRRVIVTSGGNDTGINWKVVGTNASGNVITDTFAGASGGAAQSNLDFVTVISITPSGAVASTATAGTNGVAATPWQVLNWHTNPINMSFAIELVSGAINYTVQYTYDDPNNLLAGATMPEVINDAVISAVTATADGSIAMPISAMRVLINSGTGAIRVRILQAGIG